MSVLEQVLASLFVLLVGGGPCVVFGYWAFWLRDDLVEALMLAWCCSVMLLLCAGCMVGIWQEAL